MKTIETHHIAVKSKSMDIEIRKLQKLFYALKKDCNKTKKF